MGCVYPWYTYDAARDPADTPHIATGDSGPARLPTTLSDDLPKKKT